MPHAIDIEVYELPTVEATRAAATRSYLVHRLVLPRQRVGSVILAAIVSIGLHLLFVGSFWRGGSPAAKPPPVGAGSSSKVSGVDSVMTLILFNTQVAQLDEEQPLPRSLGRLPRNLPAILISPDNLPGIDDSLPVQASDVPASASDLATQAARAKLYGRYAGQVRARIERVWVRPRSSPGGPLFNCRVQIVQRHNGDVRETTLQRCNGDVRWQQSLVDAIQAASPLPAPPDPSVYADAITLEFKSLSFEGLRDLVWVNRAA